MESVVIFVIVIISFFSCLFFLICNSLFSNCDNRRQNQQIIPNLPISDIPPQNDVCPICQEKKVDDKWLVLPCKHKFHSKCITQLTPCPICGTSIVNEKKSIEYV
jgi:RNA polymerase subunit RPABC4/transcription elongation factor Spt4